MTNSLKVLVTGATGKQGGAVARRLREHGHTVRAVTRHPGSPAAEALANLGMELVSADLADRDAMDLAMRDMDAVFSMATPFEAGMAVETQQGTTTADAAKAAGAFLLYSSVGDANRSTGIPHFDSKFAVEQHIQAIGADATIIAPVYFMENLEYLRDQMRNNIYPTPLSPDRKLAQISLRDIASVAVAVFEDRTRYAGKRFDISADDISANDVVRVVSEVTGRPFRHYQVPMEVVRSTMNEDAALMFEYFEHTGYHADHALLAREFPTVHWTTFESMARTFNWGAFLTD